MEVCDAGLRFTYVSIGSVGKESDGGIFQSLDFGRCIETKTLSLLHLKPYQVQIPYLSAVFVGDAAFSLLENLMQPYPGVNLSPEKLFLTLCL